MDTCLKGDKDLVRQSSIHSILRQQKHMLQRSAYQRTFYKLSVNPLEKVTVGAMSDDLSREDRSGKKKTRCQADAQCERTQVYPAEHS